MAQDPSAKARAAVAAMGCTEPELLADPSKRLGVVSELGFDQRIVIQAVSR